MRLIATTLGLAVVGLVAAGCGGERGDGGGPLRVELVPFAADPEMPTAGWSLRADDGRVLPLAPTGTRTARGVVLEARGAEARYALHGPEPWSLVGGTTPVPLRPGLDPLAFGVGRRHSIYLVPSEGRRVGGVELRRGASAGQGGENVPFERADGDDGKSVLRLAPDAWRGVVEVRWSLGDEAFARPDVLTLPPDGTCTGAGAREVAAGPVAVLVLPSPAEGTALGLTLAWGGIAVRQTATLAADGTGQWPAVPSQGGDAATAAIGPTTWPIPLADLAHADVRLVAPPGDGAGEATLRWPGDLRAPLVVQARREGAASYGLVSGVVVAREGEAHAVRARLSAGRWRLYVADDERGGVSPPFEVVPGGVTPVEVAAEPLSTVRVALEGGIAGGRRLLLEVERDEDGRAVAAHGWVDRAVARPEVALRLPTGDYRLRLSDGARAAPASSLRLDRPSTRAVVRLPTPR